MIFYKSDEEIELIRQSCLIVSKVLGHCATRIRPGITGNELDKEAEEIIRDSNAVPGFKGYNGFPNTLCISKNSAVVHGIPDDQPFEDGDIVSIDCGSYVNSFFGDAAFTFALGNVSEKTMELLDVTYTSLYKGIEKAVEGSRIGDIGFAIQEYTEREHKYGVVRELVGHGVGRSLHEAPEVPNYGKRGRGIVLKEGLVIAIEPMINLGKRYIRQADDGWTIITKDHSPSAHYEHTVAVRKGKADILSTHEFVLDGIKNNPYVRQVSLKSEIFAHPKIKYGETGLN